MKEPKFATLLLESNKTYPIYKIHYSTKLVTLIEEGVEIYFENR